MDIITQLQDFAKELNDLLAQGKTLKQIRQYTYEQRELGRNIPYMQFIINNETLTPAPVKKQKELVDFFDEVIPGKIGLQKNRFYMTPTGAKLKIINSDKELQEAKPTLWD